MNDRQDVMWEALCGLTGEDVLRLFTDWLGLQVLDDGFYEHLQDEGILPDDEIEESDEDVKVNLQVNETDDLEEFCNSWYSCRDCPVGKGEPTENLIKTNFCKNKFRKLKEEAESDG